MARGTRLLGLDVRVLDGLSVNMMSVLFAVAFVLTCVEVVVLFVLLRRAREHELSLTVLWPAVIVLNVGIGRGRDRGAVVRGRVDDGSSTWIELWLLAPQLSIDHPLSGLPDRAGPPLALCGRPPLGACRREEAHLPSARSPEYAAVSPARRPSRDVPCGVRGPLRAPLRSPRHPRRAADPGVQGVWPVQRGLRPRSLPRLRYDGRNDPLVHIRPKRPHWRTGRARSLSSHSSSWPGWSSTSRRPGSSGWPPRPGGSTAPTLRSTPNSSQRGRHRPRTSLAPRASGAAGDPVRRRPARGLRRSRSARR